MAAHPLMLFLGGLVVILLGAEGLLRGAVRIASMMGISPMLIGMTIVALGTSAPELAIGITAALDGKGDLAAGNIAGTNIFNILFILGLSAAIRPLPLHEQSIRLDVPVMIAAALVLIAMAADGVLGRVDGMVLFAFAIVYTAMLIRLAMRAPKTETQAETPPEKLPYEPSSRAGTVALSALFLLAGIALTVVGANIMVDGATSIARALGVSDAIIGLTIVAVGTSAPEFATTIVSTIRGQRDVAVGNLIGSSISNILVILGLTCIVSPHGVDVSRDILLIDLPLSAAVAVVCYPVFRSDKMVSRTEGIAFVSAYVVYLTTLLVLRT